MLFKINVLNFMLMTRMLILRPSSVTMVIMLNMLNMLKSKTIKGLKLEPIYTWRRTTETNLKPTCVSLLECVSVWLLLWFGLWLFNTKWNPQLQSHDDWTFLPFVYKQSHLNLRFWFGCTDMQSYVWHWFGDMFKNENKMIDNLTHCMHSKTHTLINA